MTQISEKEIFARAAELTHKYGLAHNDAATDAEGNSVPIDRARDRVACLCAVGFLHVAMEGTTLNFLRDILRFTRRLDKRLLDTNCINYGGVVAWVAQPTTTIEDLRTVFEELAAA